MNPSMNGGEDLFREQLAAYALGALDRDEAAALEAHLPTCAACRAELAEFEAVVPALAFSLDVPLEPAGHRERFLSLLNEANEPAPQPAAPVAPEPRPAPRRPWWQAFNPFAGWAAAGLMAVLLIAALLWGAGAQQRATDAERTLAAQQARSQALAAILANPNARRVTLAGQGAFQDAGVQLWVDPASGRAVLVSGNLAAAPAGKLYELWLIKDQTPVAIDVFQPTAGPGGVLFFNMPGALSDYAAAAITIEPSKQPQPTSTPILVGQF
jgi:anti-sigma-K factor RskA